MSGKQNALPVGSARLSGVFHSSTALGKHAGKTTIKRDVPDFAVFAQIAKKSNYARCSKNWFVFEIAELDVDSIVNHHGDVVNASLTRR